MNATWGHPRVERLSRMLDGMLEFKAKAALARHLADCSDCRQRQEALAQVRTALQDLPAIETRALPQPQVPSIVPAPRPSFLGRGILLGILLGVAVTGALVFWLPQPALKVISSQQLRPGTALQTLSAGHADLELPGQLLLRLKPGTTMTWQQTNPMALLGQPKIVVNLMQGELLARTKESFWGSHLQIRTPSANAFIKGTAFSMAVDPHQETTTLKVLAGSVFFSPHLGGVGVNVGAGQMSRVQAQRLPKLPKPLSSDERKALLETYRIGQGPRVALVVGGGPERVTELFQPPLLFVSMRDHPQLQFFLRKALHELNRAVLEGDLASADNEFRVLEVSLSDITDPELYVPLRLFAGSIAVSRGRPYRANAHFQRVLEQAPWHPMASLALAAVGVTAEKKLGDLKLATESFQQILARHPKSPEADLARDFLKRHSR